MRRDMGARVVSVPYGIVSDAGVASGSVSAREAGMVFVGRLAHQKRIETLMQAYRTVQERLGDGVPSLCLVGDGGERAALEALSRQLACSRRRSLPAGNRTLGSFLTERGVSSTHRRARGCRTPCSRHVSTALPSFSRTFRFTGILPRRLG